MLRRSQHHLNHEYLTETLGLFQGATIALMGRQIEGGWSAWDAECTERELDQVEVLYYRDDDLYTAEDDDGYEDGDGW